MSKSIHGRIDMRGIGGNPSSQPHDSSTFGLLIFSTPVTSIVASNDQPPSWGANTTENGAGGSSSFEKSGIPSGPNGMGGLEGASAAPGTGASTRRSWASGASS